MCECHFEVRSEASIHQPALNRVHNMAVGVRITIKQLFDWMRDNLVYFGESANTERDYRAGDVRLKQPRRHQHSPAPVGLLTHPPLCRPHPIGDELVF